MANVVPISDPKIEVDEAERARRVMNEATRLAGLSPGEWKLWYRASAEWLDIPPEQLAELVEVQIAAREQAAREKQAADKLLESRAERQRKQHAQQFREAARAEDVAAKRAKQKSKAFADIIKLPADQHAAKIGELATTLSEDAATLTAEFAEYREAEIETETTRSLLPSWEIEPWAESVTTAALLEELIARINRHIIAKPHEVLIVALWVLFAWVHDIAHFSPYLVATSPVPNSGKTTLTVKLIGRLAPRAYQAGAATAASIFHITDSEAPTLILDNVDDLFKRKPEVVEIFLLAHTRDVPVPRVVHGGIRVYNVFSPKCCSLVGTDLHDALATRCILIELWPKKRGEIVEPIDPLDPDLMEEFRTLRRKLARWAADHAPALKGVRPAVPESFINRSADNWLLIWAIADLAGGDWPELARNAAEHMADAELIKPTWLARVLEALWVVFVEERRKKITSAELVKRLMADPTSVWRGYDLGRGISQHKLAVLFGKIHIHPRPMSVGEQRLNGYWAEDFFRKEAFERILGRDLLHRSRGSGAKE